MQLSTSTLTAPNARKGIVAVLAVTAAAATGVGLAVVTSDGDTSPSALERVTPAVSTLPQGNEGKAAPEQQSSSPVADRFHRFQH
jgi:hypothetical protein